MIHPTPTKTLLTTTFESLVMQLSGLLARGTRLIDQFVQAEPTPTTTMAFERELSALLREVGRRIMAWTLNRLEPEADDDAPSRVAFEGRLYRRRRQHPHVVGTLFGSVTLWRRLYEPLGRRGRPFIPWSYVWGSKRAWPRRLWPSAWATGPPITPNRRCWRWCSAIMV